MMRFVPILGLFAAMSAHGAIVPPADPAAKNPPLAPRVVTEPLPHDTDDPAIWVDRTNPAGSLIIGTDKHADGALVVFGLDGKIRWDKSVRGLLRPNNVDVACDVRLGAAKVDVAVTTERYANRLRIYRVPEMAAIDGGGIPVFEGETARECMGIALYTRPRDGALFAIVSRSDANAPRHGYLAQYRIADSTRDSDGSDVTNVALPGFPGGLFVAMSADRTFHFYAWDDMARAAGLQ